MLAHRWANQFKVLPNQSNFHEEVRLILATYTPYSRYSCYQEVPVHELIEDYENRMHRYDFYIRELNLIIEVHGRQHYEQVSFGKISYDAAAQNFQKMKNRDWQKKQAAIDNGYEYLEIHFKNRTKLDFEKFHKLVLEAL